MPFWSNKTENYKAKLEHKICIAKEAPDEIFDISDCNLSEIPSGVFSMCRVFRKEKLLLQNNHISNLSSGGSLKDLSQLVVLNLMNNKLSSLPSEISHLSNLQVLNLENNQLKKLPTSLEQLLNLCHLNLKGNRLLCFPAPICSLRSLETLNLCNNPKVKSLPLELCNLPALKELLIDPSTFTYPNPDICEGGCESVMKFLCEDNGIEYTPPITKSEAGAVATPESELSDTTRKSTDASPISVKFS